MPQGPDIAARTTVRTGALSGGPEPQPEREESHGLDDQLCFALYAATNAVVRAYRPLLNAVGVTYPQYVVLMALWEADDVSTVDLSVRVKMPLSDLAPILDRLVELELVEQCRTHVNPGFVRIALTDRGRLMEDRSAAAQHQVRCQTKLSDGALQQLRGSLHNLTNTLESPTQPREPNVDVIAS